MTDALARHEAENFIYQYCRAADQGDAYRLGEMLASASVQLGSLPAARGEAEIRELFASAFAGQPVVRHLVSNLEVATGEAVATCRARYSRWVLDPDPQLAGMGDYHFELAAKPPAEERTGTVTWTPVRLIVERTWIRSSQ